MITVRAAQNGFVAVKQIPPGMPPIRPAQQEEYVFSTFEELAEFIRVTLAAPPPGEGDEPA